DPILRSELGLIANAPGPEDPDIASALQGILEPAAGMVHPPQVIGEHPWARIDARLDAMRPLATVACVEPAGYTGLGAGDAWRCLRRPAVELFLTVRYPLINMGASNTDVAGHLDAFWGEKRAASLREELIGLGPQPRQERIIAACVDRLKERGAVHVLVFRLSDGHRCQELLFHASRELLSYARAKEILARHSTGHDQGVPDYAWDPIAARYDHGLAITRPLEALADELGRALANQVVTAEDVHRRHHVGRPYVLQNYRDALELLAAHGRAYRLGNRIRVLR
ncbi:MAG: class I SAM-dependent methyltransferase, partial [Anaerolineae bacterium]